MAGSPNLNLQNESEYDPDSDLSSTGSSLSLSPLPMRRASHPPENPLEKFLGSLGRLFAVAYGALCAMGIYARVFAAFDSTALAYAIGSATFFVNVVLFWTVVPAMLIKLFVKQDLLDESFCVESKNGQENYVKIRHKGQIEQLKFWPWQKGFSIRAWIVLSFVGFFGLCAGLAYTGLLMATLPETLTALGLASFLPMSLTLGFFFGVSALNNWFFNSYDAAEQFSKNDFFTKFLNGFAQLIGFKPNPSLLVGNETLDSVGFWSMKARQFVRFVIFAGIAYLGIYAVYAVAHLGTQGLLSYLMPSSITGADGLISIAKYGASWIQGLKWTVIVGGVVGAGFLFGVQLCRFSNYATQILTKIGQHYVSFAARAPNAFLKGVCLTFLSPLIVAYMACEGLYAAAMAEVDYVSVAWDRAAAAGAASAVPVFFFTLIRNNMHALAAINASAQGLLAIKPGVEISEEMKEFAGGFSGSMMCYANKLGQDADIAEGRATTKQEIVEPTAYCYLTYRQDERRFTLDNFNADLSRDIEHVPNNEKYFVDPFGLTKARFEV